MASPASVIKRMQKLDRREDFLRLQEGIKAQPLTASRRTELLACIMAATARGTITPQEARTLTKLVKSD